jgi:hypothetical protein
MTKLYSANGHGGNGTATVILPPTPKVITGASLAHRLLSKPQRAVIGANIADGWVRYSPSLKELAALLHVSQPYIDLARTFSPEKRDAILRGWDTQSFAVLLHRPRQLPLPIITDEMLESLAHTVGCERMLNAAAAVE